MLPKTQEQKRIDALMMNKGGDCVGEYADGQKRATLFQPVDGNNVANGCGWLIVSGKDNTATGVESGMISGRDNTVNGGESCLIGGHSNTATTARFGIIAGQNVNVLGGNNGSWCGGQGNYCYGSVVSFVLGEDLHIGNAYYCVITGYRSGTTGGALAYDCGNSKRMTFNDGLIEKLDNSGNLKITGSFGSIGADYAEYFEWADGNPDNEDRRGRFVRLKGDKIELASRNDDYIIGVVSGNPSAVGNAAEMDWHGRYERDVFGALVTETDGNGEKRRIESKKYDDTVKYIPRSERAEWCTVGLVGQLVAVDDGTCKPDWYAAVSSDGTATNAVCRTAYRVMSRVDDTHIIIFVR